MAVTGAGQLSQNLFRQLEVLVHRVGQILVEGAAVGRRHAGDVVESLGAALDFEAVHARVADEVEEGRLHPKKAKEALAYEIVARYHGEDQAQEALQGFNSVFADGGIPDDAPEFACEHGEASKPPVFLTDSGLAASRGEAKRLIKQGSLSLDGERCDDAETPLEPGSYVVKLGKKRFLRLTVR